MSLLAAKSENYAQIVECRTTGGFPPSSEGAIPVSALHFRTGRRHEAEAMVMKYHYKHSSPKSIKFIGSLHLDGGIFGGDGEMKCAAIFSIPPIQWKEPVLELSRMVRGEDKVPLTFLLSRCVHELKRQGYDLLISFADRTYGHDGYVYRAANWNYGGLRKPRIDGVYWNNTPINQRTCQRLFGSSLSRIAVIEKMKPLIKGTIEPKWDSGKHFYWLPLGKKGEAKAQRLGFKRMEIITS